MKDEEAAGPRLVYNPNRHPDEAYKLARLSVTDEGLARFLDVPVYTIYEWEGQFPDFAEALMHGRAIAEAEAAMARLRMKWIGVQERDRYPAFHWALRYCRRTKQPELATLLKAKMKQMKAIGPEAAGAFDDAIRSDIADVLPLRRIPERVT